MLLLYHQSHLSFAEIYKRTELFNHSLVIYIRRQLAAGANGSSTPSP